MAGLQELKHRLQPLLFDAAGDGAPAEGPRDGCEVADGEAVSLVSSSSGEYNINDLGFHKRTTGPDKGHASEKPFRCSSHDMHIFCPVGSGSSSIVQRAIYVPTHGLLALKKINIFEEDKREQIINEMVTLSEACCYPGLVEFHGAFYTPDSGKIYFALEYMDGGSLADIIRVRKFIPEPVLAHMLEKVLLALRYLHDVKHVVHNDLKPSNLLVNLKGDTKITDFGVTAGLHDSETKCANYGGTITYMSPERIRNESYSYTADIWSLGLTVLECATGRFPYDVNGGPTNLVLQILDDPSPTPPKDVYSSEFCLFVDACLQKDADARPTCEQLLSHPFIKRYERTVDLKTYVKSVFNPTERVREIAHMLAVHYYLTFDGSDYHWYHVKTLYREDSIFSVSGETYHGQSVICETLSRIRKMLQGDDPCSKIVHVMEEVCCNAHGEEGVTVHASGSLVVGDQFLVLGDGLRAEGMPTADEIPSDIMSKRVGQFQEEFCMEPGHAIGSFIIRRQKLCIGLDHTINGSS